jgi:hypothetical protein
MVDTRGISGDARAWKRCGWLHGRMQPAPAMLVDANESSCAAGYQSGGTARMLAAHEGDVGACCSTICRPSYDDAHNQQWYFRPHPGGHLEAIRCCLTTCRPILWT